MNMNILAVSFYIVLIYSLSLHFPILHSLFYPTLGAFCFLFISRTHDSRVLSKIVFGACLSALIGSIMYAISTSEISIFINALIIIFLIKKFHWNAPPILAVSFIPYFSKAPDFWTIPLSVGLSLLSLLLLLFAVDAIEKLWSALAQRKSNLSAEAEMTSVDRAV
jgi:hypothetical protein